MRILREPHGLFVVIGAWAAAVNWCGPTRYRNGSRWFSGWHRWRPSKPVYCPTCDDFYPPDSMHAQLDYTRSTK